MPVGLNAFPGAVELVQVCRRAGFWVAVASSTDAVKVAANLDKIGLPFEFWDAVVTGNDVPKKKPAPDIFLFAAMKLSVIPETCTVVEDAMVGVRAAKAAGMRASRSPRPLSASSSPSADVVRENMSQVLLSDLAPGQ